MEASPTPLLAAQISEKEQNRQECGIPTTGVSLYLLLLKQGKKTVSLFVLTKRSTIKSAYVSDAIRWTFQPTFFIFNERERGKK